MGFPTKLRSRIKEDFTQEDMEFLRDLETSPNFTNNNDKADAILYHFRDRGFIELAPATNRFALLKGRYVYKFALDHYGKEDNENEFNLSPELQPFVTKTYETNGYIAIAEYVNLISREEFVASTYHIREILKTLAQDYIFSDVGTIVKNSTNWGFRDNDDLVILDYGYFYRKDPKILHCALDGTTLQYTENYDQLYCKKCGKKYGISDIIYRMGLTEENYKDMNENRHKGPLIVQLAGMRYDPVKKQYKPI